MMTHDLNSERIKGALEVQIAVRRIISASHDSASALADVEAMVGSHAIPEARRQMAIEGILSCMSKELLETVRQWIGTVVCRIRAVALSSKGKNPGEHREDQVILVSMGILPYESDEPDEEILSLANQYFRDVLDRVEEYYRQKLLLDLEPNCVINPDLWPRANVNSAASSGIPEAGSLFGK